MNSHSGARLDSRVGGPRVRRARSNPIIQPGMAKTIGTNLNGPCMVRVPRWAPLHRGQYLLYFGHHRGDHIRLAYADTPYGPWMVHTPGVLSLGDVHVTDHIASPDVHVLDASHSFRMYFHGVSGSYGAAAAQQCTEVATSTDGVTFKAGGVILDEAYLRAFFWRGAWYAVTMPGRLYRSPGGINGFVRGPDLLPPDARHCAVSVRGDLLWIFFSQIGDAPEHIKTCTVDLTLDWERWTPGAALDLMFPRHEYEGIDRPVHASHPGQSTERQRQLQDPFVYSDGNGDWIVYAAAGESNIALARLYWSVPVPSGSGTPGGRTP